MRTEGGKIEGWVLRAQDRCAPEVLAETAEVLADPATSLDLRELALYARAIAFVTVGNTGEAIAVAQELASVCREIGLTTSGIRATALLADLLRMTGRPGQAVEQLAHAVALEPGLRDVHDPDVQRALGNLAAALRMSGVRDEAQRVESRLAGVEGHLGRHQRVARWSNLAIAHAIEAMGHARHPPFRADVRLLGQAVEEIRTALGLGGTYSYAVIADEAEVLAGLFGAVAGDPERALRRLAACQGVLDRGHDATRIQPLWGAAHVRALCRCGRTDEAVTAGRDLLARIKDGGDEADRLVLAYEVMRAERADLESSGTGAAAYVALAEARLSRDQDLVGALFRARVDLLRGADERRSLARVAEVDPLTALVNRRGALPALESAASRPQDEWAALLLIDLDGFKQVNDEHGHLYGDRVLQGVAAALRTAARSEDVVARWGGDEFLVVAVLDPARAMALADRLRETVRITVAPPLVAGVTASVGVAVRDSPLAPETWLRRADQAMYAAKRAGGDAAMAG